MVFYTKTDLVAGVLTLTSLIINGAGTFSSAWWSNGSSMTSGLWSKVVCHEGICRFATAGEETETWISVAQCTALVEFIGLIAALLIQLLNFGEVANRVFLRFLTLVALGLACLFAHVHTFMITSLYGNLAREFHRQPSLPVNYAYFLTLPVGLNAISGTISIGPLLALIVVHTKEKKSKLESGKDVPKASTQRNPKSVKATVV